MAECDFVHRSSMHSFITFCVERMCVVIPFVASCVLFLFVHGKDQCDLLKILKCKSIFLLYDEGINNDDEICR